MALSKDILPIKPIEEWESEIKAQSLDLRTPVELAEIKASHQAKIPRVQKDLNEFRLFPEAKKKEIYEHLVRVGEIEAEPDDAVSLSSTNQARIDAEFNSQLQFYVDKIARLKNIVVLADKVVELREKV